MPDRTLQRDDGKTDCPEAPWFLQLSVTIAPQCRGMVRFTPLGGKLHSQVCGALGSTHAWFFPICANHHGAHLWRATSSFTCVDELRHAECLRIPGYPISPHSGVNATKRSVRRISPPSPAKPCSLPFTAKKKGRHFRLESAALGVCGMRNAYFSSLVLTVCPSAACIVTM